MDVFLLHETLSVFCCFPVGVTVTVLLLSSELVAIHHTDVTTRLEVTTTGVRSTTVVLQATAVADSTPCTLSPDPAVLSPGPSDWT